ncbi:MAG TPA: hypothetical protein VKQ07_01620, partial [Jatrophihabitantaceae bacterium]|nr:hypothetical protein [Jatrophihabitantaceae bacterium]
MASKLVVENADNLVEPDGDDRAACTVWQRTWGDRQNAGRGDTAAVKRAENAIELTEDIVADRARQQGPGPHSARPF